MRSERARTPAELAEMVPRTRAGDRQVDCIEDAGSALAAARAYARQIDGGLVVVAGSIFLVGALRSVLLDGAASPQDASDPLP